MAGQPSTHWIYNIIIWVVGFSSCRLIVAILHMCILCGCPNRLHKVLKKVKDVYSSSWNLRATERHLPYGITQCYPPPDTGERQPGKTLFNLPTGRQAGT